MEHEGIARRRRWLGWIGFVIAACVMALPWSVSPAGAAGDVERFERRCIEHNLHMQVDIWGDWVFTVPEPSAVHPAATIIYSVNIGPTGQIRPTPGTLIHLPFDTPTSPQTVCVGIPNRPPEGRLLITKVSGRAVGVFGYVYDPEDPADRLTIRGRLDGHDLPQGTSNTYAFDPKDQFPAASSGHGVLFLVGNLDPGDHTLCLWTKDPMPVVDGLGIPSRDTDVDCTSFRVK